MTASRLDISGLTVGNILAARAAEFPDRPYLFFGDEVFSFADALTETRRAAAKLVVLGVGAGDRVVLMLDNRPDYLWILWGCGLIGAVGVPLNTAAKGAQLAYYLADSDPSLVIAESKLVPQVQRAAPQLARIVAIDPADGVSRFGSLPGGPDDLSRDGGPEFHDLALLMYTSGTTGPSKGVMCPHAHPLSVARYFTDGVQLGPDDRMYVSQPMFHSAALWWGCLSALWAGASVVVAERFSASRFWQDICRYDATWFSAVMTMVAILQKQEVTEFERKNPAKQGFIIPVPQPREEFERRMGVTVTTNYAMTEIHPAALLGPDDGGYDRPATAGRVCEHDDLRIVDAHDLEVPPGTIGEIVLRPRDPWSFFAGYWRKPEATADAFRNGWFHTGDLASVDDDGFLFFEGRKKDAIRRRGENISAQEVEDAILTHPGVRACAVVGVSSELGEQDVVAYVVRTNRGMSERDLLLYAADNMAYYMVPRYVEFVAELPQTESFKVKKFELAARAEEHRDALWDREQNGITIDRKGVHQG